MRMTQSVSNLTGKIWLKMQDVQKSIPTRLCAFMTEYRTNETAKTVYWHGLAQSAQYRTLDSSVARTRQLNIAHSTAWSLHTQQYKYGALDTSVPHKRQLTGRSHSPESIENGLSFREFHLAWSFIVPDLVPPQMRGYHMRPKNHCSAKYSEFQSVP